MLNNFCKVFQVAEGQVLIIKNFSDEDDEYKIDQITETENIRMTIGLGYEKEEVRDQNFEKYSQEDAEKFVKILNNLRGK